MSKTLIFSHFIEPVCWLTVKLYHNSFYNTAQKIFTTILLALLFHEGLLEIPQFRRKEEEVEEEESKEKGEHLGNL